MTQKTTAIQPQEKTATTRFNIQPQEKTVLVGSKNIETLLKFLNEKEVAALLGVSVATVRRWRLLHQGPRYLKLGSSVRYSIESISVWLQSRPTGGGHVAEVG